MKMKFTLLLLLSFLFTVTSNAQNGRIGIHEKLNSWSFTIPSTRTSLSSVSEAKQIASQIIEAAGATANFEIREANVPNAAAVLHNGKRYILYNPQFVTQLNRATGTKWASISVLAHEIGHHLNRHTVNGRTSLMATEIEADEFSGFVLRKMGATLDEAQAAMKLIGNSRATSTHPAGDDRLAAISKGWDKAGGRVTSNDDAVVVNNPVRTEKVSTKKPVTINNRKILADINFNADRNSRYYLTSAYEILKLSNNRILLVGKMQKLNSNRFPYMLYDAYNTRLYVTKTGMIVNRNGNNVGRILERNS